MRTFEDTVATRQRVPLMIGLMGPSGGGKTFSALRLATGIQRIAGGDIYVIDTESRRALHYADKFKFRHLEFRAPFSPLDYLAAIEHCVSKGATTVIVDSASHEHEGPGGVLEMHAAEVDRLAGDDFKKAERVKMLAWSKPKQQRRRMINSILQMPCNAIFCFRCKEKLKIKKGEEPEPLGFMPIAGDEWVYEMALNCLLLPNAGGVPTWDSNMLGEQMMIKCPEQFRGLLSQRKPLDEEIGEGLARWAAGGEVTRAAELRAAIRAAETLADLEVLARQVTEEKDKRTISPAEYKEIKELGAARKEEIAAAAGREPGVD